MTPRPRSKVLPGLAILTVLATGGAAVWGWWHADLSTSRLARKACNLAQSQGGTSQSDYEVLRCTVITEGRMGTAAWAEVERVERRRSPMIWSHGQEPIHPAGTLTQRVRLETTVEEGNFKNWPPMRPRLRPGYSFRVMGGRSSEELWRLLEAEPENAMHDAMRTGAPHGVLIYLSGLRRLGMWSSAVSMIHAPQMEWELAAGANDLWLKRFAAELRAINAAPLQPRDRREYERFLQSHRTDPSLTSVLGSQAGP